MGSLTPFVSSRFRGHLPKKTDLARGQAARFCLAAGDPWDCYARARVSIQRGKRMWLISGDLWESYPIRRAGECSCASWVYRPVYPKSDFEFREAFSATGR